MEFPKTDVGEVESRQKPVRGGSGFTRGRQARQPNAGLILAAKTGGVSGQMSEYRNHSRVTAQDDCLFAGGAYLHDMTVHFPFQNTYAALPANFFARVVPTPVASPRLIKLNRPLALQLGLDPDLL